MIIRPPLSGFIGPSASGAPSGLSVFWVTGAEHEANESEKWGSTNPSSIQVGITDAHGRVYFTSSALGSQEFGGFVDPVCGIVRFRPTVNTTNSIIDFREDGNIHLSLQFVSTGALRVARGGAGPPVLAISATGLMSINNWYYAELLASIHDTSGFFTVRLWDDAGTILATLSDSSVDTRTGGAVGQANGMSFGGASMDSYIDDVAIDTGGGQLGRCLVVTRNPTGDGDLVQWPRGGTDTGNNYDQINEASKDTVSYVQSSAADQFDFYDIDITSLGGTMKALQVNALGRSSSGTAQFKIALRIGGVTYEDSATQSWTSTVADFNRWAVWSNNPATGGAWTGAEIVQIGVKSVTSNARLHQCCAEILVGL